jgi:predicted transcriptional regulator
VKGERRHVLAEHDLGGRSRVVEVGAGLMRPIDEIAGVDARFEIAAEIGVSVDQAIGGALDHLARCLSVGRVIEIDARASAISERQSRKLRPGMRDVESGRHGEISNQAGEPLPIAALCTCLNRRFPACEGRPLARHSICLGANVSPEFFGPETADERRWRT